MPQGLMPGTIAWHDLSVSDAARVRDFYTTVVGWDWAPVEMSGYSDFNMLPASGGDAVAGVCHARGANAELPAQWLMYIVVDELDRSIRACREAGGAILTEPRSAGGGRYAVIRDPAGAVCALYQPAGPGGD